MKKRKLMALLIIKDILIFFLGVGIAIRLDYKGPGAVELLPVMMIMLVIFGWQLRGYFGEYIK